MGKESPPGARNPMVMPDLTASRTLVKSAPELWAECSDAAALARHLGAFGEIRITRLEPEVAVAWEGDAARGTVTLEPSGWGTKVVLTATADAAAREPETVELVAESEPEPVEAVAEPEPEEGAAEPEPELVAQPPRRGLWRLLGRWRHSEPDVGAQRDPEATVPAPALVAKPAPAPASPAPHDSASDVLTAALDSLGRAHHRPYSRG